MDKMRWDQMRFRDLYTTICLTIKCWESVYLLVSFWNKLNWSLMRWDQIRYVYHHLSLIIKTKDGECLYLPSNKISWWLTHQDQIWWDSKICIPSSVWLSSVVNVDLSMPLEIRLDDDWLKGIKYDEIQRPLYHHLCDYQVLREWIPSCLIKQDQLMTDSRGWNLMRFKDLYTIICLTIKCWESGPLHASWNKIRWWLTQGYQIWWDSKISIPSSVWLSSFERVDLFMSYNTRSVDDWHKGMKYNKILYLFFYHWISRQGNVEVSMSHEIR